MRDLKVYLRYIPSIQAQESLRRILEVQIALRNKKNRELQGIHRRWMREASRHAPRKTASSEDMREFAQGLMSG